MKRLIAVLCCLFWPFYCYCFSWSDLWFTADQQGQQSMAKADYAKAKEQFERHDWAASAAYRAGDYEMAASLFKQLPHADDYYNQGNALAHLGRYEQALTAYTKALELNPQHQDAQYNHKLISDLLKKDQEQQKNQNKDQQDKDQQDKDQQDKDQQDKDQQDKDQQNKDQQDKDQQDKDQQDKDQQDKDQQNKDQQSKDQQSKEQQNKEQQNKEQQNKDQQNKDQQNKDQQNKEQQNKDQQNKEQQDKEQQNKEQQNKEQQNKEQQNKEQQNKEQQKKEAELAAEKEQAKEQWLRLIPDDPGGLIREKFLRDHIRRERGWYQ